MMPTRLFPTLALLLLALAGGCQMRTVTRQPAADLAPPPPPAEIVELLGRPLVPEELADRIAVRGYEYTTQDDVHHVAYTLENLTADQTIRLQLAAVYLDADGGVRHQSEWVTVELPAGRRHHYYSQATGRAIASGRALLREIQAER